MPGHTAPVLGRFFLPSQPRVRDPLCPVCLPWLLDRSTLARPFLNHTAPICCLLHPSTLTGSSKMFSPMALKFFQAPMIDRNRPN